MLLDTGQQTEEDSVQWEGTQTEWHTQSLQLTPQRVAEPGQDSVRQVVRGDSLHLSKTVVGSWKGKGCWSSLDCILINTHVWRNCPWLWTRLCQQAWPTCVPGPHASHDSYEYSPAHLQTIVSWLEIRTLDPPQIREFNRGIWVCVLLFPDWVM